MKIKKLTKLFGLAAVTLTITNQINAQESCDSTCYAPLALRGGFTSTKTSITKVTHNYNDYTVRYEYRTDTCPAGYRGRNGATGVINERRAIITFNKGGTEVGEWIAMNDNCEVIPPSSSSSSSSSSSASSSSFSVFFTEVCSYEASILTNVPVVPFGCAPISAIFTINLTKTSPNYLGFNVNLKEGTYSSNQPYNLMNYGRCRDAVGTINALNATFDFNGQRVGLLNFDPAGYPAKSLTIAEAQAIDSATALFQSPYAYPPNRIVIHTSCVYPFG